MSPCYGAIKTLCFAAYVILYDIDVEISFYGQNTSGRIVVSSDIFLTEAYTAEYSDINNYYFRAKARKEAEKKQLEEEQAAAAAARGEVVNVNYPFCM